MLLESNFQPSSTYVLYYLNVNKVKQKIHMIVTHFNTNQNIST